MNRRLSQFARYLDARLVLFILLALGASIISSHGAWLFFGYLVNPWLAGVFILVVALGIIGLDAAGTLERGWRRVPYYAGMTVFLVLETLANYFAGQSTFVSRIVEKLATDAPDSDLLAIARNNPATTRLLVILFLSMASIAVALFTFAAATRFAQLRSGAADRPRSIIARLRKRYSAVVGALRATRALLAAAARDLTTVQADVATLRSQLTTQADELEQVRAQSARAEARAAATETDLRTELEQVRGQSAGWARAVSEAQAQTAALRTEVEQVRTQAQDQVTSLRTELEHARTEVAELRIQSAALAQEEAARGVQAARLEEQVRTEQQESARLRERLAHQSAELEQLRREKDELSAAASLDLPSIAQALRDEDVSARAIGRALRVSDKTVRNWTSDGVTSNGHLKEQ